MNKTKYKNISSNNKKNVSITKIILSVIGVAGILTIAAVAPNALQALKIFDSNSRRKSDYNYYVKNALGRLQKRDLIRFEHKNNKTFVRLTDKGKQELLKYQLNELEIKKPKKWDGKWRIIIFDIKEFKRGIRDGLRRELINLGFVRLQNSVWVHPYECEEVTILLKSNFYLGKEVLYIIADKIENDRWLKKEFCLN